MTTNVTITVPNVASRSAVRVRQVSPDETRVYSEELLKENDAECTFAVHSGARLVIEEVDANTQPSTDALAPRGAVPRTAEQEKKAIDDATPKG
jgi:hypothetical protein